MHSNVGGGYPDDSLAHVSLTWMLSEARSRGLTLKAAPGADPDAFTRVRSTQDKDGRIYDSRNGLGGYYRYGPRSVAALSDTKFSDDKRDRVTIAIPKIHESVFERISVDAHVYAPVALPPVYEVLTYDERIVSPDNLTVGPNRPQYESSGSARHREKTQERVVGSSIWRRRIIYFLTVIASVYLLAYPVASQLPASAEYTTRLRPLSDLIRIVGMALPEALSRWKNAYARDPLSFVLHAGLVALLLWLSVSLRSRITDQMRSAWRLSLSKFDVHPQHSGPRSGAGVLLKFICLCLLSIALYPAPGWLGYPVPKAPEALQIFIDRITTPYFRFFAIAILITMLLKDSTIAWFRLKDGYKQAITTIKLKIAPGLFAVLFLYGGLALASHYIFNVRDSFGAFCQPDPKANRTRHLPAERTGPVQAGFQRQPSGHLHGSSVVELKPNLIHVILAPRPGSRWSGVSATNSRSARRTTGHFWVRRRARPECRSGNSCRIRMMAGAIPPSPCCERQPSPSHTRSSARSTVPLDASSFVTAKPATRRTSSTPEEPQSVDQLEETFRPTRDGELFVYLNKPVSGFGRASSTA